MLTYSRWRPEGGGYDYFASAAVHNLNDDLPTPELRSASKIGVPSIEAGRPIPPGSRAVGHGEHPKGLVAPVDASRLVKRTRSLAGVDGIAPPETWVTTAAVVGLGGLAVWWLTRRRR